MPQYIRSVSLETSRGLEELRTSLGNSDSSFYWNDLENTDADFERIVDDPTCEDGGENEHRNVEKWSWKGRVFSVSRRRKTRNATNSALQQNLQSNTDAEAMNEFMALMGKCQVKQGGDRKASGAARMVKAARERKRLAANRKRLKNAAYPPRKEQEASTAIQCWWRCVAARQISKDKRNQMLADIENKEKHRSNEAFSFIKDGFQIYEKKWMIPIDFVRNRGQGGNSEICSSIIDDRRAAHITVHQSRDTLDFSFLFHVELSGLWQLDTYRIFTLKDIHAALLPLFRSDREKSHRRIRTAEDSLRNWAQHGGELNRALLISWLLARSKIIVRIAQSESERRSMRALSSRLCFDVIRTGAVKAV